jgi:hypothetical protein
MKAALFLHGKECNFSRLAISFFKVSMYFFSVIEDRLFIISVGFNIGYLDIASFFNPSPISSSPLVTVLYRKSVSKKTGAASELPPRRWLSITVLTWSVRRAD